MTGKYDTTEDPRPVYERLRLAARRLSTANDELHAAEREHREALEAVEAMEAQELPAHVERAIASEGGQGG